MAAGAAGLSTLGVRLGYALETVAGTKPTRLTWLTRVNAIGGISLETETIDASALEDMVERSVPGRQSTGGTFPVTFNLTNEVVTELETMISTYKGRSNKSLRMWFEVYHPDMTKAFWIAAAPPSAIPLPDTEQNGLWTVEVQLTIDELAGLDTKVEPEDED